MSFQLHLSGHIRTKIFSKCCTIYVHLCVICFLRTAVCSTLALSAIESTNHFYGTRISMYMIRPIILLYSPLLYYVFIYWYISKVSAYLYLYIYIRIKTYLLIYMFKIFYNLVSWVATKGWADMIWSLDALCTYIYMSAAIIQTPAKLVPRKIFL
jgi:hypothetical protein